jgi:ComF family protein
MESMTIAKNGFNAVLNLLFPHLCACCHEQTPITDSIFCVYCENRFGYCEFENLINNPLMNRWTGRIPVAGGVALVYFREGNQVQFLLHRLKYQQQKNIGYEMGKRLGNYTQRISPKWLWPEYIIPVPLHSKKEYQRGYNQSYVIAKGIADVFKIPVLDKALYRRKNTVSQTRKNKMERMENVRDAFDLKTPESISHKRILLVDDVFTSGATLEACIEAIQKHGNPDSITLACLALADA